MKERENKIKKKVKGERNVWEKMGWESKMREKKQMIENRKERKRNERNRIRDNRRDKLDKREHKRENDRENVILESGERETDMRRVERESIMRKVRERMEMREDKIPNILKVVLKIIKSDDIQILEYGQNSKEVGDV